MSGGHGGSYSVATATVRGPSHVRSGAPNQDAVAVGGGDPLPLVVAVADGHGSDRSFRSDRGSQAAVEIAVEVLHHLAQQGLPAVVDRGPAVIVERWRDAVLADAQVDPPNRPADMDELLRAYGSTLVAAVATADGLAYLQLGDGDVLEVAADGSTGAGLDAEPGIDASETTSLCLPDASQLFRTRVRQADDLPALLLLATDGYSNSFLDEASFRQVGSDLLTMVRAEGLPAIEDQLPHWLEETTTQGSGDDVTVAMLVREASTARARKTTPSRWPLAVGVTGVLVAALVLVWTFFLRGPGGQPTPAPTTPPTPSPATSPEVAPDDGDSPTSAPIQDP